MHTSTLSKDANNEAWGFRDFVMTVKPCPDGCTVCSGPKPNECAMWAPFDQDWTTPNFDNSGWTVV